MRIEKPFFAYRSFNKELATVKRFYDAGIRQFCVFPANTVNSMGQYYSEYTPNWHYFGGYEFEHVDQQINDLLEQAPEAELLFMVDLNAPYWLVRTLIYGGSCDSMGGLTDALTMQRWRDETLKYMQDLVKHVEETFPGRIAAYILACGQTDEWMDVSQGRETPCKREAYRKWCAEKGCPVPDSIPTIAQRTRADGPYLLRSAEKDSDVIQYYHFISDCVAESICFFAKEIRKIIPGTAKLGCFFGYILELRWQMLVQGGHLGYEKVFSCPELDFFISPGDYHDREMGGASGYMSPNGTIHLKDKNFFYEIDHRTHTANMRMTRHVTLPWMNEWPDEKADIAGLRREFCLALFHGASLWWFDMWGKFYESQALVDEIARMKELYERFVSTGRQPEAEVALIVDPESTYYVHDGDEKSIVNLYTVMKNNLNRLGAPYRTYSFNDIPRMEDLDQYKMVILPGYFEITPEKEAILRKYLLKNDRTVVWTYAAAISDGKRDTFDAMAALTGFPWGTKELSQTGMDGWKSVYAPASEALPPETLRQLAKEAGVHLFSELPCPVWYGEKLLMVHTAQAGRQRIALRHPAKASLLLGRKEALAQDSESAFTYDFDAPETILVELL